MWWGNLGPIRRHSTGGIFFNMSISIVNDSQHHRNRMGLQINVG